MLKRACEDLDFVPPNHVLEIITGHMHATAELEMLHVPLTKEALAAHAASHSADLVSEALTTMAKLHEQNGLLEEVLYQFQNATKSLQCSLRAFRTNGLPVLDGFLPWFRRFKKNLTEGEVCLSVFQEALGQLVDACNGRKAVSPEFSALKFIFNSVSRSHHFYRQFMMRCKNFSCCNMRAVQNYMDVHKDACLELRSIITQMQTMQPSFQKIVDCSPAEALKGHEESEFRSASLPNDVLLSPISSPSSGGFSQSFRYVRNVSPVFRQPISISGCLDAVNRATKAGNCVNARQYRMLAAMHFQYSPSRARLAWMMLSNSLQSPKNVKAAVQLVENYDACSHCQGVLAMCLYRGQGVAVDRMRAVPLARQSAAAGSKYGQFVLGCYYHDEHDSINAIENFKLSAQQRLDAASYELGCMALQANALEEATRHLRRAAQQGFGKAFRKLAGIADNEKEREYCSVRANRYESIETMFPEGQEEAPESAYNSDNSDSSKSSMGFLSGEEEMGSRGSLNVAAAGYGRVQHARKWVQLQSAADGIPDIEISMRHFIPAPFRVNCVDSSGLPELKDYSSSNGSDILMNRSSSGSRCSSRRKKRARLLHVDERAAAAPSAACSVSVPASPLKQTKMAPSKINCTCLKCLMLAAVE
jgi:TPR repeat protein